MEARVRITKFTNTTRYGRLNSDYILTTDAAFAKHLVDDCKCAEYLNDKPAPEADAPKPAKAKK